MGTLQQTREIHRILRTYFKNLYSNKLENEQEMGEFLDIYNLSMSNQGEISNLNRVTTPSELEVEGKISQPKYVEGKMDSVYNSTSSSKKKLCQYSLNYPT